MCMGCKRSVDEIRSWILLPKEEKERILKELKTRVLKDYSK